MEQELVRDLSPESRYYRFMDNVRELMPRMLLHFTRVDYARHMALIAVSDRGGVETQVGVARYVIGDSGFATRFNPRMMRVTIDL